MQPTHKRKGYPFIRSGDVKRSLGERRFDNSYRPFQAAIETSRTRLLISATVAGLTFAAVGGKLVDLALFDGNGKTAQHLAAANHATARADIVDRAGNVIATDLSTRSLFADPLGVLEPKQTAAALVRAFPELDRAKLERQLQSKRRFIWVKRHLTPKQQRAVYELGLPGLDFRGEHKRLYPHGELMAHVLGYTDIDNRGIAGVEQAFDGQLLNESKPLEVSLDLRVQHAMRTELAGAMETFRAKGAAGLVLDATNGEIVAMTSLPDFDPNAPARSRDDDRFNKASLGVYELGSTFKILTAAIGLETGVVTLRQGYDASKPIRIGGYTINDYRGKNRWLSLPEIIMYSSNIGAGRMALDIGPKAQKAYLGRLGLLSPAMIELPEIGMPIVPGNWRKTQTVTIGFGHGISVSPLQLASAVAAAVNGGTLYQPTVIKSADRPLGQRVFSASTSNKIRRLLRLNVLEGTGKNGAAKGYLVGGKTGTAEKKREGRGYSKDKLLSSFIGAFPMTAPRYVVFAMLDEPKPAAHTHGFATGGWVVAPAVSRVINRIAPILNIDPVDENTPAIRNALAVPEYERQPEAHKLASFRAH